MYHYVRELQKSKYPEIKGLEFTLFKEQLDYLTRYYQFISADDLLKGNELPPNPVLLTFDDGYIDHYTYVFPELKKRGIKGVFFPVVDTVRYHKVLDVNKIHFILACVKDKEVIENRINKYVLENKQELNLLEIDEYKSRVISSRFDTKTVMYIKCMLQKELPPSVRSCLISCLFSDFVSADENDFAESLYAGKEQLAHMNSEGMAMGIHTRTHSWLGTLTESEQIAEIDESINMLNEIHPSGKEYIISYPYGSYNETTLKIAAERNIKLGFTTKVDLADMKTPLELSRYDTNDFPKDGKSEYKEIGAPVYV